jgi:EAL domain-containing protein (putative c-di-GMP-specific phosphodiesterase class I)
VLEASEELTTPVGEWIIDETLRQQREWHEEGLKVQVSVNLFGLHLQPSDFVKRVEAILQAHPGNDPTMLDFELVETTVLDDLKEITPRIHGCKRLGIGFSLDDFGTGYSSLTYVHQLPVCIIKVDRSFVRDILHNEEDLALVENIIDMAHTLDRQVVAEGLVTIEHSVPLIPCGCDFGQGNGIARPMPPADLIGWVAQWRMPPAWSDADSSAGARVT